MMKISKEMLRQTRFFFLIILITTIVVGCSSNTIPSQNETEETAEASSSQSEAEQSAEDVLPSEISEESSSSASEDEPTNDPSAMQIEYQYYHYCGGEKVGNNQTEDRSTLHTLTVMSLLSAGGQNSGGATYYLGSQCPAGYAVGNQWYRGDNAYSPLGTFEIQIDGDAADTDVSNSEQVESSQEGHPDMRTEYQYYHYCGDGAVGNNETTGRSTLHTITVTSPLPDGGKNSGGVTYYLGSQCPAGYEVGNQWYRGDNSYSPLGAFEVQVQD